MRSARALAESGNEVVIRTKLKILIQFSFFTSLLPLHTGDLLENYCYDDMNLARVLFCVSILLTFPLECFVSREVRENLRALKKAPKVSFNFNFILPFLTLPSIVQIIKTQIKRFYSHELVEYDKNVDPRKREDSEDKVSALETHSDANFIHADLQFCSVPPAGSDNHFTSRLFGIFHLAHERVSRTHFGAERESCAAALCVPFLSVSFSLI